MRGTRVAAVMLAAVAMVGLTGCEPGALSPDPSETTGPTTTPSESTTAPTDEPTEEPSETPVPTDEPTEEPSETPVPTVDPVASGDLDLACDQVVTPQQVYDLNPNFAATDAPSGGVPAQVQAVADAGGTVCAWQHTTNGDPLIAAVAYAAEAPDDAAIDASEGSLYILGEIVDDYWIVVASPYFSAGEPGASDLVAAIAGNLPDQEES